MKSFYCLLLCLFTVFCTHAQDRITSLQGDDILAKVLVIDSTHIYYFKTDSSAKVIQPADTQMLKTAEVFMITYANGSKDLFATASTTKPGEKLAGNKIEEDENFILGQQDAKKYFDGTGAFFAGFGGLLSGALVVASKPQIKPNRVSDPKLIANNSYRLGYEKEARHKKLNNAIAGFTTASVLSVIMVVALVLSAY